MSSKGRIAIAPARVLHRGLALVILIVLISGLLIPSMAYAYRESAMELVAGNVIVQNQSYSTTTRQNLFHAASAAGADTESFAFGSSPEGSINLAQTSSSDALAQETGFFDSSATSDIVLPVPLGQGYLGTFIGDPISISKPAGSGLLFPQMIKIDGGMIDSHSTTGKTNRSGTVSTNNSTLFAGQNQTATMRPAMDTGFNNSSINSSTGNDTLTGNVTKDVLSQSNATNMPSFNVTPVIKPTDPLGHQTNKPFTLAIFSPGPSPHKVKREKVENMTSWERFMMNTIGRSTTDRGINGTISQPVDIRPDKILAPITPFLFIEDALSMTLPGARLSNRMWPL